MPDEQGSNRGRFCHACGSPLAPAAAFCESCGTRIRTETTPAAETTDEPTEQIGTATEPTATVAASTPLSPPSPVAPRSQRRAVALRPDVILLVAGLVVAGIAGYLLTKSDSEPISTSIDPVDDVPPPLDYEDPEIGTDADLTTPPTTLESPLATPTVAESGIDPALTTCSNAQIGYSLSFPATWYTASNGPRQDCRFFDPEPFTPPDSSEPESAIQIYHLRAGYEEWIGSYNQEDFNTLRREDTTIGGHEALLIEVTYEDETTLTAYIYNIELNGRALVLATQTDFADDYEATKLVIDQIAASLVFL